MTPERWGRLSEIFNAARELDPAGQDAFLTRECAGDEAMRSELIRWLEQDAKDAQFEEEVSEQANKTVIDITDTVEDLGPAEEKKNPEQPPVTDITPPAQEELKATGTDGPGY